MEDIEKVVVIGSGCAGATAAIYLARANLSPVVINGNQPGGQLTTTSSVENFPGFVDGINGFDLTYNMKQQAQKFGAKFVDGSVISVDFSKKIKEITCEDKTYYAISVVIATGSAPKLLGVKGEKEFFGGSGVSVCATCDGALYKGKDVAVVGGGDVACEEAIFLTNFCSNVYLIHRRNELRASKFMQRRVLDNKKITMVWNSVVDEIFGNEKVEGAIVKNVLDQSLKNIKCSGVFMAIGNIPNTKPFANSLKIDDSGYIVTMPGSIVDTSVDGVFVAGDCSDKIYRQAITSSGTGAMAAISAEKYICAQMEEK